MTSADKFGVIFSADTAPAAPSVAAPAQTYSPPPAPAAAPAPTPSMAPQAAPQTSSSDNLKYTIRGGIVDSISQDEHHNAVKIMMDSRLDGQLTITVTDDAVTPFEDGTYFVTIDGEEVDFTQVGKRLTIEFMANSQKVMIFGEGYKSGGHSMGHSEDSKEHEAMMAEQQKPQQQKPQQQRKQQQRKQPLKQLQQQPQRLQWKQLLNQLQVLEHQDVKLLNVTLHLQLQLQQAEQ